MAAQAQVQAQQRYQLLRQEYSSGLSKLAEIEGERREHSYSIGSIVLETLRKMAPERRCWRLVGGALVERTVDQVIPALEQNLGQMETVLERMSGQMKTVERELLQLQQQLGIAQDQGMQSQGEVKTSGVLVT